VFRRLPDWTISYQTAEKSTNVLEENETKFANRAASSQLERTPSPAGVKKKPRPPPFSGGSLGLRNLKSAIGYFGWS